jgi:hypothetical protein
MEIHQLDSSVLVAIAVLVSIGRLTRLVFGTLRGCICEYYAFRIWLRNVRRAHAATADAAVVEFKGAIPACARGQARSIERCDEAGNGIERGL